MERKIITFDKYFKQFYASLTAKQQDKVLYGLMLLRRENALSKKLVKHLCKGLFELRVEYESNTFRIFFIFDEGNIVVLFNGFQKKTQKTPRSEINKALKLKEAYYDRKRSNH